MRKLKIVALIALLPLASGWGSASAASYYLVHTHSSFGALFSLAVDPHNNLYVTDQVHYTILKLSPAGRVLARAPLHEKCGISGVAATPSGDIFAVSNCQSLVFRFSPAGRLLSRFGRISLLGPGANGVTSDAHGTVYVTYSGPAGAVVVRGPKGKAGKNRPPLPPALRAGSIVREFTASGTLLRTIKLASIHQAWGLAVDRTGNIYVTAAEGLLKVAPNGHIDGMWKQAVPHYGPHARAVPIQPAVDGRGNVYAIAGSDNIFKVSPSGRLWRTLVTSGTGLNQVQEPTGLAVDDAGHLFVAEEGPNRIKEFSLSGKLIAVWTP